MKRLKIPAPERLIVALDVNSKEEALELVGKLDGVVGFYKVGWQLFIKTGMEFVGELIDSGKKVFLDLKMGDIEETIRRALANLPDGIELLTIHGNGPTVEAAKLGRNGKEKPKLLMLTALSSQDTIDIRDMFADSSITRENYVSWKGKISLDAGCEGLIASGDAVSQLREEFSDKEFIIVTPGIRPSGFSKDDHKFSMTPYDAIISGADYLVVGRPITKSSGDSSETAKSIISEIQKALDELDISNATSTPSTLN
ncbi:MAG: orotidine-5'-phosphate decarboxylase [Proteobacteria bacterium]|nr:orotidine-5'-phosphate decarboxylase [Pseudomonadota bacterium]